MKVSATNSGNDRPRPEDYVIWEEWRGLELATSAGTEWPFAQT
jgi:hypothetical protein